MMRGHIDAATVATLAADIAAADGVEFSNQFPAYHENAGGETLEAVEALKVDALHRRRYDDFVAAMVYGEKPNFETSLVTVLALAEIFDEFLRRVRT